MSSVADRLGRSGTGPEDAVERESAVVQRRGGSRAVVLTIVLIAGITVVIGVFTDGFLTVANMRAILRTSALTGIVAVAMTPMLLSGNLVSLGTQQSAMLGMVIFVSATGSGWPVILSVVVVLVTLLALGAVQAILVTIGLSPVITTLAAGAIVFGLVSNATGGALVSVGDHPVSWGGSAVVGIPIEVLAFVLFTVVVSLLVERTVVGRHTLLVGANRATAVLSGISFGRVTMSVFLVFSVGLALAGVLSGAAFGQATINSFEGLTIDSIAAILVGGSAIRGGRGSPLYSAIGALFIAVTTNIMILHALSTGARLAIQGGVVVVAVVAMQLYRRRVESR